MKPIERVKKIIDLNSISISAFEKAIGASNNSIQIAIKRVSNLKDETLNNILNKYKEIDPTWLLTGKGNMLLEETPNFAKEAEYGVAYFQKENDFLKDQISKKDKEINRLWGLLGDGVSDKKAV